MVWLTQMTYSSGYKSELAYAQLAITLLEVAGEVEMPDSKYEVNEELTRRLMKLKDELASFLGTYVGIDFSVKYDKLINRLKREKLIQPDFLACYVLLIRFQPHERNRPLHQHFEWITSKDGQLCACIDMIKELLSDELEESSYLLAIKLSEEL